MSVGGIGRAGGPSDFEYDHPEVLDGAPALSEGAESEAAAVASARRRPPAAPSLSFDKFRATNLRFARDGGTVTFEGKVGAGKPRAQAADLRYDGRIGSPTRGQVFVKLRGPGAAERQLTADERKSLVDALERQLRKPAAGEDPRGLRLLLDRLAATGAPPAPPVERSFVSWTPNSIETFRDGGTMRAEGPLDRYAHSSVRFDGRIGSPTRGKLYLTIMERGRPPDPERPITKTELASLRDRLKTLARERPDDPQYPTLLRHVETALRNR